MFKKRAPAVSLANEESKEDDYGRPVEYCLGPLREQFTRHEVASVGGTPLEEIEERMR